MIIEMAKVELVGPKPQLMAVLDLLRGKGIFQPEADIRGFIPHQDQTKIKELLLDETAVGEKLYFVSLRDRILDLLACLPDLPSRTTYLRPLPIVDVLNELVGKHLDRCRNRQQQQQALREETEALSRYLHFWTALEPLVAGTHENSSLAFFGVTIRKPEEIPNLRTLLEKQTAGRCRLSTASIEDGSLVGLITTDRDSEENMRQLLSAEQVPELSLPSDLAALPFHQKSAALRKLQAEVTARLDRLTEELSTFAHRWLPIYRQALRWLEERIALYQATASAYETRQCFFVHGWMASAEVEPLRRALSERFHGQVVLDVLEIHAEDLDRVPVVLHNPLYFKPFELFARLLPLPKYSSYDPTPFLGLFFPLLFGMILGDIGYGLLLAIIAGLLISFFPERRNLADGARILGVSAAYTILFGILFGELFGSLGEQWLHLPPLWAERSQAVVPMILFAISVGATHVLLGLALGIRYDLKRRKPRGALVKTINLLVILLGGLLLAGQLLPAPWQFSMPLLLAILALLPLLVFAGGLLAPLELLKIFGNILSYVRIMAIGLCSVLLAHVANQLGGMTGNLLAGFLVAGLLHLFNLLLGVFAPTVHALRLHYVEFFSKFIEFGGRRFEPLNKHK